MAFLYSANYTGFPERSLLTEKFIWPFLPIADLAPSPNPALLFFRNVDQPRIDQFRVPNISRKRGPNLRAPVEKKCQTKRSKPKDAVESAGSSDSGVSVAAISSSPARVSVTFSDIPRRLLTTSTSRLVRDCSTLIMFLN